MNLQCKNILKSVAFVSLFWIFAISLGIAAETSENSGTSTSESEKKIDVKYSGVFNGRQIIPNSMAIYCKTNAEDMLKDTQKLYECINKIVKDIKNKNALFRQGARNEYHAIRFEALREMMAQSVAKGATIANYEEVQNSLGEATSQTQTEHEDNVAIASAVGISTDVMNTMRDLYAERLKYEAILGIENIELSALGDIEDDENEDVTVEEGNQSETETSSNTEGEGAVTPEDPCEVSGLSTVSNYSIVSTSGNKGLCSSGDRQVVCPDGIYNESNNGGYIACKNGYCGNCLKEAKVVDSICTIKNLSEISGYTPMTMEDKSIKCKTEEGKFVDCPDGIYNKTETGYKICKDGECRMCAWDTEIVGTKK